MKNRFATLPPQKHRKSTAKGSANLEPIDLELSKDGVYLPAEAAEEDQPPRFQVGPREVLIVIGVITVEAVKILVPFIFWTAYGVCFAVYYLALGLFDVIKEVTYTAVSASKSTSRHVDNSSQQVDTTHGNIYQSVHIIGRAKNVTINQQNKM